tara:strand:- start:487 stop:726 length:240 start_codon:yes stop_codon:yes gene_type:complete
MSKDIPLPKGWKWSDMMLAEHNVVVKNPYTGVERELTPIQEAVYSTIRGAEMIGHYTIMQQGLNWFRQYYADIYMDLLD